MKRAEWVQKLKDQEKDLRSKELNCQYERIKSSIIETNCIQDTDPLPVELIARFRDEGIFIYRDKNKNLWRFTDSSDFLVYDDRF